ncbi:TRAP-type mannitol/chloroaromatic compound transport system, small permease component [Alteromonadaceae bacterium Bs31]|nr:TRAP-type mannitol/chloroaromatic compound transport system, small permease component [Alteromonadaceae bacterium Bs31]
MNQSISLYLVSHIDALSQFIGKALAWLTLLMVLLVALVVAMRTFLDKGSIPLQESITYMHAAVFLLCLGYNVQQGAHVRVDVFYGRFNKSQKAWVDAIGAVCFLLPFALFLMLSSLQFVANAWQISETSADPGGLPFVYALKTLIPLAGLLLALQALAEVLRALHTLCWADNSEPS